MGRLLFLAVLLMLVLIIGGCGGGDGPPPSSPIIPSPTDTVVTVGPLQVRPASTSGFVTRTLTINTSCSFVAMYGAEIQYMESRALLDRIVFSSNRDGYYDIWMCDLDGSNLVQLTNNAASDRAPEWSPDGKYITFHRTWPCNDSEIMIMDADGSNIRALTNNTATDSNPTFSPDGRRIAFSTSRTGNLEIFTMYSDGSSPSNLTNNPANDSAPGWQPGQNIAFTSDRDGNSEVYTQSEGGAALRVTNTSYSELHPSWHANGYNILFTRHTTDDEVFITTSFSTADHSLSNSPNDDDYACSSTDGRYIAYASRGSSGFKLMLQQWDVPAHNFQLTHGSASDIEPHLGSPIMQTERVLIGPPGSDWGGYDPIWSSAYAGIVAFDDQGYRNFVRIGVAAADTASIEVTPLATDSWGLVATLVEANEIINLREDAGRGCEPTLWQFGGLNVGAAALYFNGDSGKLISVLILNDSAYPAAVSATDLNHTVVGDRLVVSGDFSAVFDAQGRNLGSATRVSLDTVGGPMPLD